MAEIKGQAGAQAKPPTFQTVTFDTTGYIFNPIDAQSVRVTDGDGVAFEVKLDGNGHMQIRVISNSGRIAALSTGGVNVIEIRQLDKWGKG